VLTGTARSASLPPCSARTAGVLVVGCSPPWGPSSACVRRRLRLRPSSPQKRRRAQMALGSEGAVLYDVVPARATCRRADSDPRAVRSAWPLYLLVAPKFFRMVTGALIVIQRSPGDRPIVLQLPSAASGPPCACCRSTMRRPSPSFQLSPPRRPSCAAAIWLVGESLFPGLARRGLRASILIAAAAVIVGLLAACPVAAYAIASPALFGFLAQAAVISAFALSIDLEAFGCCSRASRPSPRHRDPLAIIMAMPLLDDTSSSPSSRLKLAMAGYQRRRAASLHPRLARRTCEELGCHRADARLRPAQSGGPRRGRTGAL